MLIWVTKRLEFVGAPLRVADVARYRAWRYPMRGNLCITIDRPMGAVDVHGSSASSVDMAIVTVEDGRWLVDV